MTISRSHGIGCGVGLRKTDMRREQRRRKEEKITMVDWLLTVACFLLILAIGAMLGYGWRAALETSAPRRDIHAFAQIPEAEKRWLNERFLYHGIWASIEENGKHYFYRDGKKCKL